MTDVTFDTDPEPGSDVTLDVATVAGTDVTLEAGTPEGTDVTLDVGPVEGTEITFDAGPVEGTDVTFDIATPGTGGGVELGETSTTAYRGDRGKTAYDHSQATGNPHGAAVADITGLTSALAAKLDSSDASVTNSRTPTAHAASHASAGSDPITVAQSQVTNLGTDLAAKVPTTRTVAGHALSADVTIAPSDLTTNPLARANHTGTQTLSTISDAGTLAGLSTITSSQITDGTIVDADINASAAIAATKLATPATGLYVSGALYSTTVRLGGSRSAAPGTLYFWPLDFDGPTTIDGLSINVVTGGSSGVAHMYVVTGSATTGRPTAASTILATCSNVAVATNATRATASFDSSATLAVTRGRLWGAVHAIVGTATYQACDGTTQLGPPYVAATTYSANGLSGIGAAGGGTSTTALTTLAGISITSPDVNQGPVIYWRAH